MKKTKRLWALLLAMVMALGLISTAFAAPTIDSGRKASLSLYKYDITAASEDGAWNTASYVSTGVQDDTVTDKLAQYAIQGVEFTYLRVADIAMNNELVDGQRQVGVLYGFAEGTVLQAIGLTAADAHKSENGTRYYTADKLNKAMSDALTANATTVKNALEAAARNGGKAMPETDENGHSKVSGLEQGLYLVVETRVPENVTSTCNPFFVSLPMTTIDGKGWNYALLASGEAERSRLWKKRKTSAHPSRCRCTSGFGRSRNSGARPCPTTSRTYSESILKEAHEL